MKKVLAALLLLALAFPPFSLAGTVAGDADVNGYLDINKGGTNNATGLAATATALAADPANCAAGQIALGITAAGVAECTATPSGLTSVGATTFTGALTGNASTSTLSSTATVADDTTTNATMYPVWVTANTGGLPLKVTSTKLSFNPSTGILTVTGGITVPPNSTAAQSATWCEDTDDGSECLVLTATGGASTGNNATFSATGSLGGISFSALNLVTTGTIDGAIKIYESTDATVTVAGASGYYVNSDDDAITFNLPAVPTGKGFCFGNLLYAQIITVNPDDADYIVHDGVTAAAGEAYLSPAARDTQLCVVGINGSYWKVTSEVGAWVEASP